MEVIENNSSSIQLIYWILGILVPSVILLFSWIINKVFELDKKIALNSQNDQSVKVFLEKFEITIEKLAKEVRVLNNAFLREFPNSNHGIE